MTPRYDRTRPEPAAVQARIQADAIDKRVRKAAKRRKDAELTVLGRELARAWLAHKQAFKAWDRSDDDAYLAVAPLRERHGAAIRALNARRVQS